MFLHADAIAENRPASVGTGRINRDYAHRACVFAVEAGQLIDQRALPRSRRPRQPKHARLAAVLKQSLQQLGPSRRTILHSRNRASQSAHIAGAKLVNPCLRGLVQAISVKQKAGEEEIREEVQGWVLIFQQLPRNHQPLNLAGTLANRAQLHIAVILLGGIIFDESVPTVNLHPFIGAPHGNFAGVELRH
jgi:hypothetical protein